MLVLLHTQLHAWCECVCSIAGESQRVFNIGTERAPNFGMESREVSDPRVQGESSTCSDETRHARRSTMHTGPCQLLISLKSIDGLSLYCKYVAWDAVDKPPIWPPSFKRNVAGCLSVCWWLLNLIWITIIILRWGQIMCSCWLALFFKIPKY